MFNGLCQVYIDSQHKCIAIVKSLSKTPMIVGWWWAWGWPWLAVVKLVALHDIFVRLSTPDQKRGGPGWWSLLT